MPWIIPFLAGAAVVAVIAVTAWLIPWGGWWADVFEGSQSAGPERGITLNEVVTNFDRLAGTTDVTISARVSEVLGPHALVIGREGYSVRSGGLDEPLVVAEGGQALVVSGNRLPEDIGPGDAIQVQGTVYRYPLQDTEIGEALEVDLDDEEIRGLGVGGMLLATDVEPAPETSIPGDAEEPGESGSTDRGVTLGDIASNTSSYLGQTVTVSGEIEDVITPHAFILGDRRMIAIGQNIDKQVVSETLAILRATVIRYDREAVENQLHVQLDESLDAYAGEPVLLIQELSVIR